VTFFILLVVIAAIAALVVLRKGEAARFETQAAPSQVIMAATAAVGTGKRWSVTHQTDNSVTFNYVKKPSKLIALIGILFFFVPGVVYLMLAGKKETLSFMIDRSTGNTIVQATSNGYKGKAAARGVRQQLAVAVGTSATSAHAPSLTQGQPVQLPQQRVEADSSVRSPELA
jgi:hypothetical protein